MFKKKITQKFRNNVLNASDILFTDFASEGVNGVLQNVIQVIKYKANHISSQVKCNKINQI